MSHLNMEIKARCGDPERIRAWLRSHNARFVGTDHQTDVYLRIPGGRLKVRRGNVENNLIYYRREDLAETRASHVHLAELGESRDLDELLVAALGVLAIVDKRRDIFFLGRVKFHVDEVRGLGSFVEIEAIGSESEDAVLRDLCLRYQHLLGIRHEDLIEQSYSDLVLEAEQKRP